MGDLVIVGEGDAVRVRGSAERWVRFEIEVQPPDAAPAPQPPMPPPEIPEIRAYSQTDPRWADEIYAGGVTFRRAGCLVVSVAMIASMAYEEEAITRPPMVARRLREVGAFAGALLSHPARIAQALPALTWNGAVHWRHIPARIDRLAEEVARYGATICEVLWDPTKPLVSGGAWNQHFVVVVGVDEAGDDATIIDPWDGKEKALSASPYAAPKGWGAQRALYGMRLVRVSNLQEL
jgi:hypothetical protein